MENKETGAKSSLRWRILRWGLIGIAGLVTFIALIWAEENWRGKRAWEKFKAEWEAKGEKFDLKSFVPPPAPDEQNFAMTPFLAPLYDFKPNPQPGESRWRDTNAYQKLIEYNKDMGDVKEAGVWSHGARLNLTGWSEALDGKKNVRASPETPSQRAATAAAVLTQMKRFGPVLEELSAASRRPYCRFNIGYSEENTAAILLPHLALMKKLSQQYCLRACAELAAGQGGAALEDIRMGFYLAESLKDEPFLISGLVRVAIINITLQPVWEGLADRRWSDAQLQDLEKQLGKIDLLSGYATTIRGERACGNGILDFLRNTRRIQDFSDNGSQMAPLNLMPSGWNYQNELTMNRMYQELMIPTVDGTKHRVYLDIATNADAKFNEQLAGRPFVYTVLVKMLFPAVTKSVQKYAYAQSCLDEAAAACALERYRLAKGRFPETLAAVSPQFIEKPPVDVVTGELLKYRLKDAGQFILYSVGWNGVDDGGTRAFAKGTTPSLDIAHGDWVWENPGK
jgi:hypothetical protein